jgi:hypothetical protein
VLCCALQMRLLSCRQTLPPRSINPSLTFPQSTSLNSRFISQRALIRATLLSSMMFGKSNASIGRGRGGTSGYFHW